LKTKKLYIQPDYCQVKLTKYLQIVNELKKRGIVFHYLSYLSLRNDWN